MFRGRECWAKGKGSSSELTALNGIRSTAVACQEHNKGRSGVDRGRCHGLVGGARDPQEKLLFGECYFLDLLSNFPNATHDRIMEYSPLASRPFDLLASLRQRPHHRPG